MKNINLQKALYEAENRKIESGLIEQVSRWLNDEANRDADIWRALRSEDTEGTTLPPHFVESKTSFSKEAIQSVAVKYRLRFLKSHLFQGEIPQEAIVKIKQLENRSHTQLNQFYILAPAQRFQLGDCNEDPLLFVPLSNGRFHLVHQWGNDLKWYRQWLNFPLKNWRTLTITLLAATAILTLLMPNSAFSSGESMGYFNSGRIIFFFWINLLMAAVLSYAGFAFNFTFSAHNWNSKFFNG